MKKHRKSYWSIKDLCTLLLAFSFFIPSTICQFEINHVSEEASNDLVLFCSLGDNNTYLINKCGELINQWQHEGTPGLSAMITPDGNLLRAERVLNGCCEQPSAGGLLQLIDWDGNILWEYQDASNTTTQHHDFALMPNGHILYTGWEAIPINSLFQYFTGFIWTEYVKEIRPIGSDSAEVIWEWHLKNHLIQDRIDIQYSDVSKEIGKVDIFYQGPFSFSSIDRWHINAIDYNPKTDQILLNSRNTSEVWIIDHSTTTQEAAGNTGGNYNKGGQILFRWGNPEAHQRGTESDIRMYGSHGTYWIKDHPEYEDYILYFNNWNIDQQSLSTIEMIKPSSPNSGEFVLNQDSTYTLDEHIIVYGGDQQAESLSSRYYSNAEITPVGFLINEGQTGHLFEINNQNEIVWDATALERLTFKVHSYSPDYEGFTNHDLTPISSEHLATQFEVCNPSTSVFDEPISGLNIFPNPVSDFLNIEIEYNGNARIYDSAMRLVIETKINKGSNSINCSTIESGILFIQVESEGRTDLRKIIKL